MDEQFSDQIQPEQAPETRPEEVCAQTPAAKPERDSDVFYWLNALTTALVCLVLVFTFFGRLTRVDGHSMDNTLQHNELLLVWSVGYKPARGDIVIVNKTVSPVLGGDAIVKRVIATGGQSVDIDYASGTVSVDGAALDEPYIRETMRQPGSSQMQNTHFEIPEGSVFVMGDNRNNSTDSRHAQVGTIDEGYVLGRAMVAIWPLSRVGTI